MKKHIEKSVFLLGGLLVLALAFTSCEQEPKRGTPRIDYVRLTDPEKADSTFSSAFMGQLIAIVGENLGGTVEIKFNDREANLNPAYVTEKSILVNVPGETPDEVTNTMVLTFDDGTTLSYPFIIVP